MIEYRYWLTLAALLTVALLIGATWALRPFLVRWIELHYGKAAAPPPATVTTTAQAPPAALGGR